MKLIAAAAALLAFAGSASAQMYAPDYSPDYPAPAPQRSATPPDYNGAGGPQWNFMTTHGYTTSDAEPVSGGDALSDRLSNIQLDYGESQPPMPPPGLPMPPPGAPPYLPGY